METLTELTERENLILQTREEVERELASIGEKLKEPKLPKKVSEVIDVITPDYGPGDEVSHRVTDTAMLFKVMEVSSQYSRI